MNIFPYHRIVVIGTTGSGKSTLAEKLSQRLNLKYIDLDALHWEPNWVEAPDDIFIARVDEATLSPAWVVAGNYSVTRPVVWTRAQAILWLDYPLWIVFRQLTLRTFRRWWTQEHLWGTNYENLWTHFKIWSEESLWHWLFKTYWRRKREFPVLFKQYPHLKVIHFTNPKEADAWLTKP